MSQNWFFAPGEAKRIGRDSTIGPAPSRAVEASQRWLAGIMVAAGAIAVLWAMRLRHKRCVEPRPGSKPSRLGPDGKERL